MSDPPDNTEIQEIYIDDDNPRADRNLAQFSGELDDTVFLDVSSSTPLFSTAPLSVDGPLAFYSQESRQVSNTGLGGRSTLFDNLSADRNSGIQLRSAGPVDIDNLLSIELLDPTSKNRYKKSIKMTSGLRYHRAALEYLTSKVNELKHEIETLIDLTARPPEQAEQLETAHSKLKAILKQIQAKSNIVAQAALAEPDESTQSELMKIETEMNQKDVEVHVLLNRANKYISEDKSSVAASKLSKLDIPKYYGDYLKYIHWKNRFTTLTSIYDEKTRREYLIESLKDKAYTYVEDLVTRDGSLAEIWKQLEGHFGNPYNKIDSTIKEFFELSRPSRNIADFERHFIQVKNKAANIISLGHTIQEILAAYYMLQIPGDFRAQLEKRLDDTRSDRADRTKFTFDDLAPLADDIVRIGKNSMANDEAQKEQTTMYPVETNALVGNAYSDRRGGPAPQPSPTRSAEPPQPRYTPQGDTYSTSYYHRPWGRGRGEGANRSGGRGEGVCHWIWQC